MKFNETKSQERLINLMLQAGVEWPERYSFAVQGGNSGFVFLYLYKPTRSGKSWTGKVPSGTPENERTLNIGCSPLPNWHQTIITREQYEARDGFITWHGGECPVDAGSIIDLMWNGGEVKNGVKVVSEWGVHPFSYVVHKDFNENTDILFAYRPHKPSQPQPEVCESVEACIPDQPTIEQLIEEWKKAKRYQEEVGENVEKYVEIHATAIGITLQAKKAIDDALLAAGYFVGGTVVDAEKPTITDWRDLRVGDEVKVNHAIYKLTEKVEGLPSGALKIRHEGGFFITPQNKWSFVKRP